MALNTGRVGENGRVEADLREVVKVSPRMTTRSSVFAEGAGSSVRWLRFRGKEQLGLRPKSDRLRP